jgi:hypothetical protein
MIPTKKSVTELLGQGWSFRCYRWRDEVSKLVREWREGNISDEQLIAKYEELCKK